MGSGGTVTVGVGTGGGGIGAATAVPARAATPRATGTSPSVLIHSQLRSGRFGCGYRSLGKIKETVAVAKRDYYEVLGVSREADSDEIRRAFHALARDWHPDVAEGAEAETRFRELAEAYSVLSKQESRQLYDRYGYRGHGNAWLDESSAEPQDGELSRGQDIHTQLELRHYEAEEGARPVLTFQAYARCPGCMGLGLLGASDADPDVSVREACTVCAGRGTVAVKRRLRLRIPAGVEDETQLRVSGEGHDAGADSVPGDLFVRLHVLPPPNDPRAVRYVAFSLLLIAVVSLALYVIR